MLELTEDLFINSGGMRRCYRHPQDAGRCVKVYRSLDEVERPVKRQRIAKGLESRDHNVNVHEYEFWLELVGNSVCGAEIKRYFPEMYGTVETNFGLGLEQELLTDGNGGPVRDLTELVYVMTPEQLNGVRQQVVELTERLAEIAAPLYDWNPHNILLVPNEQAPGGAQVKVADLEGAEVSKQLFSPERRFRFLRRLKVRRRARKLLATIERSYVPIVNNPGKYTPAGERI